MWVAVGVRYGHDRDSGAPGLGNSDPFLRWIDNENGPGEFSHLLEATHLSIEAVDLLPQFQRLLFSEVFKFPSLPTILETYKIVDSCLDGREIGQHTPQPTLIYIGHTTALGFLLNCILSLPLGADKYDVTALGNEIPDKRTGFT